MSVSGGIISAPITYEDINTCLGTSIQKFSTLCQSSNINRWAIFKPESIGVDKQITLEQRKNNHMGLAMVTLTRLKAGGYTPAQVCEEIFEWLYTKPTGGTSSPYRISDFLDIRNINTNGYDHNAKPCDSNWRDVEGSQAQVQEWTTKFLNFSARINEQSSSYIGADFHYMPLSYVADLTNDWRIAFAIYIGSAWHFVVSHKSLNQYSETTDAIPDFSTNEYARYLLYNNTTISTIYKCVPCLIQSASASAIETTVVVGTTALKSITVANSTIYCMPSGQKTFNLQLNVPIKNKDGKIVGNYTADFPTKVEPVYYICKGYDTNGKTTCGWFITRLYYADAGGNDVTCFAICFLTVPSGGGNLGYTTAPTSAQSATIRGTLYYTQFGTAGSVYVNANVSASTTFTANGVTCYGCTIMNERPGWTFTKFVE